MELDRLRVGLTQVRARPARRARRLDGARGSVSGNATSLVASRLVVAAMGWGGTLLIVTHLSVRDWGRFSFVFAFIGLLNVFTGITSPRVVFRALGDDDGTFVGTYVLLRLAVGLFSFAVAVAYIVLAGYSLLVLEVTFVAASAMVLATVAYGFDVMFQYHLKLPQVAIAGAMGQAVQFALIIVLAVLHSSLVAFAVPAVACQVVALLWRLHRLPPTPRLRYRVVWHHWVELVRMSVPLAIGDALGILYYNLDIVMLSKLGSFHAVGLYSVAYKFAGVLLIVPQAVGASIYPLAVRHWPAQPEEFRELIRRTARLYLVIAAAATVEFVTFAPQIISLLYGHRYAAGAGAARLVVASECVGFFTSLAIMGLVSANRNRFYPLAALAGLALNFGLNLWLIPRLSYLGSAWATILTESMVAVSLWIALVRCTSARFAGLDSLGKVCACVALMVLAAVGLATQLPWWAAGAVAGALYFGALALTCVGGTRNPRSLLNLDEPAVSAG